MHPDEFQLLLLVCEAIRDLSDSMAEHFHPEPAGVAAEDLERLVDLAIRLRKQRCGPSE
jgi:hypothetical protein